MSKNSRYERQLIVPQIGEEGQEKLKNSKRIAVPGCHASGFIALVHPLVEAGALDGSENISCFSLTGYSGGGKKMIAEYEDKAQMLYLTCYDGVYAQFLYEDGSSTFAYIPK